MSVLTNTEDMEGLRDSMTELESKVYIMAESMKKLIKRIERLEKIAKEKGLLDKEADDTEACIIT